MPRRIERTDFTNPKAIALEIAAAGLLAWKLKNVYDHRNDKPGSRKPLGYPRLSETDETSVTFVHAEEDGPFTIGTLDDEGTCQVSGEQVLTETGEPELVIMEEVLPTDVNRLIILRARVTDIKNGWLEKIAKVIPDYLQNT